MERFYRTLNWIFAAFIIIMLVTAVGINGNTTFYADEYGEDLSDGWSVAGENAAHQRQSSHIDSRMERTWFR